MRKQYPAQKGPLIVKVKSTQSTDSWKGFNIARLQISVGQEYHEGQKLKAVAEWSNNRFDKIYFCVNDTLQRFNLMFENKITENEATKLSSELGIEWINRNKNILNAAPKSKIVRWDEWKQRKNYPKGFLKTEWLYQNNVQFKKAIDDNITDIWNRRQKIKPEIYNKSAFTEFSSLSRQYLIEEMATFSLMYNEEKAIDVYPGTVLFAATAFQGKQVEGAPDGLGNGHFCRIDFAKK